MNIFGLKWDRPTMKSKILENVALVYILLVKWTVQQTLSLVDLGKVSIAE